MDEKTANEPVGIDQNNPEVQKTIAINRWYIRNMGAKGFGPLADIEPHKIIELVREGKEQKCRFLPGYSERDVEA